MKVSIRSHNQELKRIFIQMQISLSKNVDFCLKIFSLQSQKALICNHHQGFWWNFSRLRFFLVKNVDFFKYALAAQI